MPKMTDTAKESAANPNRISENIRFLVSLMPSISVAARQLDINRQQLNKYLNGSSQPSLRTMRKIAAVFDLPTEALMLPIELLERRVGRGPLPKEVGQSPTALLAREFTATHKNSAALLAPYCGRYFRYNCVPVLSIHVLRSYVMIFQKDGVTYARIFERFTAAGSPWLRAGVRKTLHILSYVQDRLQFIDCGTPEGEVTPGFSLYYPIYTSGVQYLSGTLLGSFGFGARPIYSSSVVMQRRPDAQSPREDLLASGVVALDDPALCPEIHKRLCRSDGTPAIQLAG